jgi:hypothetical protein
MAKLHCPYCYYRIRGPLWFQCDGNGSPGRPGCQPVRDPVRERLAGFSGPAHPVFRGLGASVLRRRNAACPKCGSRTGIRACPTCHTPLPSHFGDSDAPLIAMVGARGTGKSVFLTVLAEGLQNRMGERFKADVRLHVEQASLEWLRVHTQRLYREHQLAIKTPEARDGRRDPLVFEWRKKRERPLLLRPDYRTSFLSFYDTAGEDVAANARIENLTYFKAARALILMLDPFMMAGAVQTVNLPKAALDPFRNEPATINVVSNITQALRRCHGVPGREKIKIPVAVTFAKMDAFMSTLDDNDPIRQPPPPDAVYDEDAGQLAHEAMKRLLVGRWGGYPIDKVFEDNFENYRYFGVSALGRQPNYETATLVHGAINPHRIDEPLVWLLAQFGAVPIRTVR